MRSTWILVVLLAGCGTTNSHPYAAPSPPERDRPPPARLRLVFRVPDADAADPAIRAMLARVLDESGGGSAVRRNGRSAFVDGSFSSDGPLSTSGVPVLSYTATFDAPSLDLSAPGQVAWLHDHFGRSWSWRGGGAHPLITPVEGTPGRFRIDLRGEFAGPPLHTFHPLVPDEDGCGLAPPAFSVSAGDAAIPITVIDASVEIDLASLVLVYDVESFGLDTSTFLDRIERAVHEDGSTQMVCDLVETTHWFRMRPISGWVPPRRAP